MSARWSVVLLGDDEGEVLARIEDSRSGLTVVRSCFELSEVLATVSGGLADAVLIVGPSPDLTLSLVQTLRSAGAAVVLMGADAGEGDWGLVTIPASASAEVIRQALETPVPEIAAPAAAEPAAPEGLGSEDLLPPEHSPGTAPTEMPAAERESPARGESTVVWGPLGAPGTTTAAVGIAAELAAAGHRTLLVDADTFGAGIAAFLGLLEEGSGLSRACRAAERDVLDAANLTECVDVVRIGRRRLEVLTGITRPERWIEVRRAPLLKVLRLARQEYDAVIVDVGYSLEQEESWVLDPGAPQRSTATLTALADADRIIAVGQADPIGLPRLVRGVEDLQRLRELEPSMPSPIVVVNKLRAEAAGATEERAAEEIGQAWARFGPGEPIAAFLRWDPPACDRALMRGGTLTEEAPRSPLTADLRDLATLIRPLPEGAEEQTPPGATGQTTASTGRRGAGHRRSRRRRC